MANVTQVKDRVARRFLEDRLEDIQRIFAPTHIILFGSRSKGKARQESDVDMILVSEHFKDMPFPDRMATFLKKIRPEPAVDAFCYTPDEFMEMRKRIGVIADAAREGIWIQ